MGYNMRLCAREGRGGDRSRISSRKRKELLLRLRYAGDRVLWKE